MMDIKKYVIKFPDIGWRCSIQYIIRVCSQNCELFFLILNSHKYLEFIYQLYIYIEIFLS